MSIEFHLGRLGLAVALSALIGLVMMEMRAQATVVTYMLSILLIAAGLTAWVLVKGK